MPLATPTILLGFLLPWAWGISSRLLQQSTAAAPYLGRGVLVILKFFFISIEMTVLDFFDY